MRIALVLLICVVGCAPETPPTPPCSEGTRGVAAGDLLIDPPPLFRCDGSEVILSDLTCGAQLTLLDVGGASFQSCIEATNAYVNDPDFRALRNRGLQIVQVFTTDSAFQPAELEFCENYSAEHDVDFEFLVDPLAYTDAFGTNRPLSLAVGGDAVIVERWEGVIPSTGEIGALLGE